MLKKTKYIYTTILIVLLLALMLDIASDDKISYLGIAYFMTFIILSFFLIARGLIYKIDTNVYFGILLLGSPLIQTLIMLDIRRYFIYCIAVFLVLWLASFVIWKYFKNDFHKKLNFLFLGEMAIFFMPICLTNLSFWYLIIMALVWLIFIIILTRAIKPKKHASKKT